MLSITLLPSTVPAVVSLAALVLTTIVLLYFYATRHFDYWQDRGVPFLKPFPFAGNLIDVLRFRKHFGQVLHEIHENMKEQPYLGIFVFDSPVLLVKDQSLLKDIFQKEFGHFTDRGFSASKYDPMNLHSLFSRKGKKWKDLRVKLSPAFTSGKLKRFYALIEENARNLDTYFDEAAENGTSQDVSDACGRFTTDVVASIGFGIESSSLRDGETEFREVLKNTFVLNRLGVLRAIGMLARMPLAYHWGSTLIPNAITEFLRRSIWATVHHRQQTGTVGVRGDFLDLLIELKSRGSIAEDDEDRREEEVEKPDRPFKLDGDEFISQAFVFLTAGFETSSTTMSFALYHLAMDQDVQDQLRERLHQAMENSGKLTYEVLQGIKYLDMIILETLRLHPVLPFLDRTCTKTFHAPGGDLVIDKDTIVMVSQDGVHRDPNIYPDPDRFDPERFSDANKAARPSCSFMAFGEGPRLCIGMRLGILQAKLGLSHILLNYKVRPSPDTPLQAEYEMKSFMYHPKKGVPLILSRLTK